MLDAAKELEKLGKRRAEACDKLAALQRKMALAGYRERTPEDIQATGGCRALSQTGCRGFDMLGYSPPPPATPPCPLADAERLVKLEAELESIDHHIVEMQQLVDSKAAQA